ncbi:MAG: hypothetical protein ABR990_04165 [Terracidiphilus sp.]|jgi:hypothetical protein
MKLIWLGAMVASGLIGLTASAAPPPSPWEKPAAELAGQIAGILGPGQARLTIRNLSTIPNEEIPAIRRLLEKDLKALGVLVSGSESANTVRLTLSENQRERLWVAEVVEGNETRVAMVELDYEVARELPAQEHIVLHKKSIPFAHGLSWPLYDPLDDPVLAALDTRNGLFVLCQNEIVVYFFGEAGWMEQKEFQITERKPSPRDPRGILLPMADDNGFTAFTAGIECIGSFTSPENDSTHPENGWTVKCNSNDDPWPIAQENAASSSTTLKAFYNASRNYFTGVISPSPGVDLPPFYTAVLFPRPAEGAALLVGGIDGKVQVLENGSLHPVSGARDWGSDFATLHSGCGSGWQIIASGSGEAANDSLRAYELPALEAVPTSAALAMDGTVTALWTAPDGKSIFAVVRSATNEYEVDRVTASCN